MSLSAALATEQLQAELSRREAERLLRFFSYAHLPAHLQGTSRQCSELAHNMVATLSPSQEVVHGLRRLLEAKDCFVRAALPPSPPPKKES